MKLRQAFLILSVLLIGMLILIGGVTLGALSAFKESSAMARHRQDSMELMSEVRLEIELLGRLVSSYVSTATPRYLIYYYDILGIREGSKPRPVDLPSAYWDEVIAGLRPYQPLAAGEPLSLTERAGRLGFDADEQRIVSRILTLAEQMKQVEQIAFAATQGLYDPAKQEFVSESVPQPAYAAQLLHGQDYLKLRGDLVAAVDELSGQVFGRTQQNVQRATETLYRLIVAALILLLAVTILLWFGYRYLARHLLAPLLILHRAANALAHKAYSERVGDVHGFVEVQALATTMDSMAEAIEADIGQREIVQRELAEARGRAEVAAEAKSIFLANMSHEIRTPMNAILGMAYLALRSDLKPAQRGHIVKIHDAAKSLLGILNDILDYSKIEAGKMTLEAAPFDLLSVVQNALFMVQQRAQDKHLELILDYRIKQGGAFVGDSLRLGQVLINLLSNAVKFTERGHVRLVVSDWDHEEGSVVLHFAVEDTGIGMSLEHQTRLFEEFSQADGSTTRKYGGTGLGLSISKRLVEAMGGQIRAQSEVDRGSRFEFAIRLPLAARNAQRNWQIRSRRALVVDDYEPARSSMADMLRQLDCPVVDVAADGATALRLLAEAVAGGQPYDLLLLDWLMPEMSGAVVIETMRASALPLPEKTIIVSALDVALLRDQVAKIGIETVLQKPLSPKLLREAVNGKVAEALPSFSAQQRQPGRLAGMRVLVVEDNEINQEVATEVLAAWGVSVDLAGDGRQALERLFSQPAAAYDLVLMDLDMPVLSGSEATRQLRADGRFADLPIFAMTAHAMGSELQAALAVGMNGHIAKPFDPDDLFELLSSHWQNAVVAPPVALEADRPGEDGVPPAATGFEHLAHLPGIDVALLERHFAGRAAFIDRLLRQFAEEQRGVVMDIRTLLAAGDVQSAQRRAHTLKGLAGTLGMPEVQARAVTLEAEIKLAGGEVEACLTALDGVLAPLLDSLAASPAMPVAGSQVPVADKTDARESIRLIRRLRHCLIEGDGEAETLWQAHQALFASCFSLVDAKRLERALGAWDFNEALQVLDAAGRAEGGIQ